MSIAPQIPGTVFYDPRQEAESKRQRKYAERLMKQAEMPLNTEMVSGIAVKRSPLEFLARGVQNYMGAKAETRADEMEAEASRRRSEMLSNAIGQFGSNPQQAALMLAQDPSTQDLGIKIAMEQVNTNPFKGNSIEAQMANSLAAKGYTPDQIAQMYYTKTITLPGGGIAAVSPQDRGLPPMPPMQMGGSQLGYKPNISDLANQVPGAMGQMQGSPSVSSLAPMPNMPTPAQMQTGPRMIREPDANEVTIDTEQSRQMAEALGVPYNPQNTLGLEGKALERLVLAQQSAAQKQLNDPDRLEAMSKAQGIGLDADRLEQLMQVQDTGGLYNIPGAQTVASWFDPEVSEIKKIQDRLTPQMRAPGSGATSDFDARMFQNALPGMGTPKETNLAVIEGMKAKAAIERDKQLFLERYVEANGTTTGADRYWQEYLDANPIFDPKSPNAPKINNTRMKPEDYFRAKAGGGMASAPQDVQTMQQEGATATNPQTGEKIIFRNGNWEPLQ
jgi:hypothetical protein